MEVQVLMCPATYLIVEKPFQMLSHCFVYVFQIIQAKWLSVFG